MTDWLSGGLAVAGAAFVLLAGVGVLRFPDLYSRMHAATKAPTLGFLLIALGTLFAVDRGRPKLALAVALIFVTAPVAAHLVGRSAYRAPGIDARIGGHDDLARALDDLDGPSTADPPRRSRPPSGSPPPT